MSKILVLQGNPDPKGGHFGHALADAYAQGAADAGHEEWRGGRPPSSIREAQKRPALSRSPRAPR